MNSNNNNPGGEYVTDGVQFANALSAQEVIIRRNLIWYFMMRALAVTCGIFVVLVWMEVFYHRPQQAWSVGVFCVIGAMVMIQGMAFMYSSPSDTKNQNNNHSDVNELAKWLHRYKDNTSANTLRWGFGALLAILFFVAFAFNTFDMNTGKKHRDNASMSALVILILGAIGYNYELYNTFTLLSSKVDKSLITTIQEERDAEQVLANF